ncbi:GNAT family N-acetyltransferase [Paenibacillus montanisoli]|uniref:GNAT family N-acetyltransferase n=1 Tax=Paenibacillus montanisoli TaxID=2081970 RepID=A0A328U698_9BACL|nr:GNAT family N-acetyltransferase [Paenibacillus montanisoli]RAP77293.1 GNAT family N-acetyltransferase [Paenibacillus montanisoli]
MITIRPYSTLDTDDLWRIHLLVISEANVEPTHQHYHDILHIPEQYLATGGEFLVGTGKDGVVLAMGGLKILEEGKAEIKRLRVHPSFQKKGYGQQILSNLEQKARQLGIRSLYLDTLENQLGAQKLFENNGYQQKEPAIIDGFNVLIFEKLLA